MLPLRHVFPELQQERSRLGHRSGCATAGEFSFTKIGESGMSDQVRPCCALESHRPVGEVACGSCAALEHDPGLVLRIGEYPVAQRFDLRFGSLEQWQEASAAPVSALREKQHSRDGSLGVVATACGENLVEVSGIESGPGLADIDEVVDGHVARSASRVG